MKVSEWQSMVVRASSRDSPLCLFLRCTRCWLDRAAHESAALVVPALKLLPHEVHFGDHVFVERGLGHPTHVAGALCWGEDGGVGRDKLSRVAEVAEARIGPRRRSAHVVPITFLCLCVCFPLLLLPSDPLWDFDPSPSRFGIRLVYPWD